jgi:hypothetical protein
MFASMPGALLASALLDAQAVALALPCTVKEVQERSTYPFNYMVAYGDEPCDNGNGSYAHGIAGNPETIYG